MRILHTADWQLGLRAAQLGERAGEVRAERLRALERMVELAQRAAVDLVIVAGDAFDHHEISDRLLRDALEQLDALQPVPVVLLPGNHDPWIDGGVWSRVAWREVGAHVRVLSRNEEVEILPGVALYPCPLRQKRSGQDPTAWIPPRGRDDRRLRIGVAHGALSTLQYPSNFPIARERAELTDLDYLALGDWHGVLIDERTAYPGSFEQTSFGEKHPGCVLLVELDPERRTPVRVESHRVGRFTWKQLEVAVRDRTDVERLRADVAALGPLADSLLRVWIRAYGLDEKAQAEIEALEAELSEGALFLEWRLEPHELAPWMFDDGVLADVDRSLAAMFAGGELPAELATVPGLEELDPSDGELMLEARLTLRRLAASALAAGEESR